MPHNAVLEAKFSDVQGTSQDVSSSSVFTYIATGGEFGFQDDRLIDATVLLVFRDGIEYYQTDEDFNFIAKQFQLDTDYGTITFPGDPWPALMAGEAVTVLYISGTAAIVVTEPVTLAEAKAWLKVESDDDDLIIAMLITAARQYCEGFVSQSFVERTVTAIVVNELVLNGRGIRLPYGPQGEIISMTDIDGDAITDYDIIGESFLQVRSPVSSWLKIVYTAGYAVLPKQFKTAVLEEIAWLYQHRGDEVLTITPLNPIVYMMLKPFRSIAT